MDEPIFGNNKKLKNVIMHRVYFFWAVRQFQSPVILNAVLFWAFASLFGSLVNFTQIITNFMVSARDFGNAMNFVASALSHAHTGTLTSLVFTSVTGILMGFYLLKGTVEQDLNTEAYFK